MIPIYPIDEQTCRPFYGMPVFAVMKEGVRVFGTLSRMEGTKLILNDGAAAAGSATASARKPSPKRKKAGKAKIAAKSRMIKFGKGVRIAALNTENSPAGDTGPGTDISAGMGWGTLPGLVQNQFQTQPAEKIELNVPDIAYLFLAVD